MQLRICLIAGLCAAVLGLSTPAQAKSRRDRPAADAKKSQGRAKRAKGPCLSPLVHVVRKRGRHIEHRRLHLTRCDGSVRDGAVDSVSVLARSRDVERPLLPEIRQYRKRKPARRKDGYLSQHVRRVHPGLVARLQKVADHWPGKTLQIISGHRPDARRTSRHHSGRALDLRVEGVSKRALRNFLRKLPDTGVGYYPNSYFVHMDVRGNKAYWVDRSGPGEPPDYGPWPRKSRRKAARTASTVTKVQAQTRQVVARALAQLAPLTDSALASPPTRAPQAAAHGPAALPEQHREHEPSEGEVMRIRAEALATIRDL